MIRDLFKDVLANYKDARKQPFSKHRLAAAIRGSVENFNTIEGFERFAFKASAGQGNWAEVPWIAFLHPAASSAPTNGFYVVIAFNSEGRSVSISLNQGTTDLHQEFKAGAHDILRANASFVRSRMKGQLGDFNQTKLDLGGKGNSPKLYESGHCFGKSYGLAKLPDEQTLRHDIEGILQLYTQLIYLGGLDRDLSSYAELADNDEQLTITEKRKLKVHTSYERASGVSAKVKSLHGYDCQACGFNFESTYGVLGDKYIEAHHLTSVASLEPETDVEMSIKDDFSVLCANCHRMIHRLDDPSDVEALIRVIQSKRTS